MPRPEEIDPGGRWLWLAVVCFGLMLVALYLGRGLPSPIYVVLVLGLLGAALVGLLVHHIYDLVQVGRTLRELVLKSRINAATVLLVAAVLGVLKLLGIW